MSLQRGCIFEPFLADVAGVGLLACVRLDVFFQFGRLNEPLSTGGAAVRLFTRVDSHVPQQRVAVPEVPLAHFAGVRRAARVDPHVDQQVVVVAEPLPTGLTGKWLLACVYRDVSPEGRRSGKRHSAGAAHVRVLDRHVGTGAPPACLTGTGSGCCVESCVQFQSRATVELFPT